MLSSYATAHVLFGNNNIFCKLNQTNMKPQIICLIHPTLTLHKTADNIEFPYDIQSSKMQTDESINQPTPTHLLNFALQQHHNIKAALTDLWDETQILKPPVWYYS